LYPGRLTIISASRLGTEMVNSPFSSVSAVVPVDDTEIETYFRGSPVPDSVTTPLIFISGV
jgi:hypothetical protein